MEANGGQTAILDRRRGNGKERGKYYEAGNGEKSNRAICQISPVGEGMRCAVPGGGVLENAPTAEKPPTGRFFWVLLIGRLSGTFSLTKALAETREIELCSISCRATQKENAAESLSATWRLTIKVFRTLRRATSRRCPLDTRFLLKRKRNLIW